MQSVRAMAVQKPVLQQATTLVASDRIGGQAGGSTLTPQGVQGDLSQGPPPPPPTYDKAVQDKRQLGTPIQSSSPVIVANHASPLPVPRTMSPCVVQGGGGQNQPPPPPYPSTKVQQQGHAGSNLINSAGKQQPPAVISQAKVVSASKPALQRKYSPSETASSSASRSESPISAISDSQQTISSENTTVSCSPSRYAICFDPLYVLILLMYIQI